MSAPADHAPLVVQGQSNCLKCGKSVNSHRPDHKPKGDPCAKCGLAAARHRKRNPEYKKRHQASRNQKLADKHTYIGVDGEGQGREHHKYVLLAASTEDGSRVWYVEDFNGLSTERCLDFLLNIPMARTSVFAYAFNYDLTKILTDLAFGSEADKKALYELFRPELRQRTGADAFKGPRAVKWNGYRLNMQGTKFTIRKGDRHIIIWDIFKFFQSKFVGALADWKVGAKDRLAHMAMMKDKRAEFDKESPDAVRAYCFEECRYMAELAHKLEAAHENVGLKLKSFYGAGSSASAMLDVMGIRKLIVDPPAAMKHAVASGFFGGRFENSVIGSIHEEVVNWDISSAYPYHITFLPCLEHGRWELTNKRKVLEEATTAVVHYKLEKPAKAVSHMTDAWAPFPFRTNDGSICFPKSSGGGWVWLEEYLMGEKLFPNVCFKEAWVYRTDCTCRPFERIPEYYCERCRIGKEGPGIVLKLGCNSCYGKLAQSVGRSVFNSWVWAGLITSGCRAQILEMLELHKDWRNMLMVATDGVFTREKLTPPKPIDTGTAYAGACFVVPNPERTGKPLGGWEEKVIKKGLFVARPGIYFPMNPTPEEIKSVRGRGIGKGMVLENWQMIQHCWEEGIEVGPMHPKFKPTSETIAKLPNLSRFCGAKTCISRSGKPGNYTYKRAAATDGVKPSYGQWITRQVQLSFDPQPKREKVNKDGLTLALREFPLSLESSPYKKAMRSKEHIELAAAAQELLEQPDCDMAEYETDNYD